MSRTPQEIAEATIIAARVRGCVCALEVTVITHDEDTRTSSVEVAHDDWCPLMRVMEERQPGARTEGIILPPDPAA